MKRNMQILVFCMLFMAFFLSGCSLTPTNTGVLIGTNLALSGKGMSYSTSTERGIELAKDMVNDRGVFFVKQFSLISPSEFPQITVGNSLFSAGLFVTGMEHCHLDA